MWMWNDLFSCYSVPVMWMWNDLFFCYSVPLSCDVDVE